MGKIWRHSAGIPEVGRLSWVVGNKHATNDKLTTTNSLYSSIALPGATPSHVIGATTESDVAGEPSMMRVVRTT